MPYGVDKKLGGDNPSNVSWMEKCVSDIHGTNKKTGKPYTKGDKIAICKAQLKRKKSDIEKEITIDPDILDNFDSIKEQIIHKLVYRDNITSDRAELMYEVLLEKSDYNLEVLVNNFK